MAPVEAAAASDSTLLPLLVLHARIMSLSRSKSFSMTQAQDPTPSDETVVWFSLKSADPVRSRSWLDPCVSSNAFILAVSFFLVYVSNLELATLAFFLFCASMAYHRSAESSILAMQIDMALGRVCCLYYIVATAVNGHWQGAELVLKLLGYLAFIIIIAMTTGPYALEANSSGYNRFHPLVHVLGVIPPFVGGILCKPFLA